MKSRGLFPGPSSRPKRVFANAAGNSEYKHTNPNADFDEGSLGWHAGRSAGGISGKNRMSGRPVFQDKSLLGDGGLAWDASAARAMDDKLKPDKGGQP